MIELEFVEHCGYNYPKPYLLRCQVSYILGMFPIYVF